jgi:hypothetical protein
MAPQADLCTLANIRRKNGELTALAAGKLSFARPRARFEYPADMASPMHIAGSQLYTNSGLSGLKAAHLPNKRTRLGSFYLLRALTFPRLQWFQVSF